MYLGWSEDQWEVVRAWHAEKYGAEQTELLACKPDGEKTIRRLWSNENIGHPVVPPKPPKTAEGFNRVEVPGLVVSMIEFKGILFIATTEGLYSKNDPQSEAIEVLEIDSDKELTP